MPKTQCCVPMCFVRGGHQFPTDVKLRKQWLWAIRRDKWEPNEYSYVCKTHFLLTDYKSKTVKGTLMSALVLQSVCFIY